MSRHTAAFVGVGHSKVYRHDAVPLGVLAIEAARVAIFDAGLEVDQIDAVACVPGQPFSTSGASYDGRDFVSSAFMTRALGLDTRWGVDVEGMVTHSIVEAINAVEAGMANYALVFRALNSPAGHYGHTAGTAVGGIDQFIAPYGNFAPNGFAELWNRYRDKYNSGRREQMATFVQLARSNGLLWDHSYWRQHDPKQISEDDYLNSRLVAEPLSVLDCDLPIQGCGAFVITTAERAADLRNPPAYVRGVAAPKLPPRPMPSMRPLEGEQAAGRKMAADLWRDSGLTLADVDVANLYDGFSIIAMLWLEALGHCGEGEAFDFIQKGQIALDGPTPLNTSGGNLGAGRMHGVPHLMDSILQVTDRSGPRQIADAEIALAAVGFPTYGASVIVGRHPS